MISRLTIFAGLLATRGSAMVVSGAAVSRLGLVARHSFLARAVAAPPAWNGARGLQGSITMMAKSGVVRQPDPSSLTVKELTAELRKRGLAVGGVKPVLIQRLLAAKKAVSGGRASAVAAAGPPVSPVAGPVGQAPTPRKRVAAAKAPARAPQTRAAGAVADLVTPTPRARKRPPPNPDGPAVLIVESPAKIKTITKFLGPGYELFNING